MRLLAGAFVLAALAGGAIAQPAAPAEPSPAAPAKDPQLARRWLAAAQQLVQKGDYDAAHGKAADAKTQYTNAVAAYGKAIAAGDDVTATYALALVEDKLGLAADAYKHLEVVAHAAGVKPDVLKKVQAKLDDVSSKVGTIALTVTPDGAQVTLAGAPVGDAPLHEPLVLVPGTYAISFSAPGYQPKDVELKVEAGSEAERKIALEPIVVAEGHIEESPPTAPAARASPSASAWALPRLPLIVGGSVTLAFAVAMTLTGVAAISQHDAFTDPTYSPAARASAQSTGRLEAHVSDACLVGVVAGAAFTGWWYVYRYRKASGARSETAHAMPKVDVTPWVQPDAGGLVAAGSF